MFKHVFVGVVFLLITQSFAQCERISDEKSGKPMLIGKVSKASFVADTAFAWWFNSEYTNYQVDTITTQQITIPSDFQILIVLGTWCSDSRREIPRFIKIAEALQIADATIQMYAVDRKKKALDNTTDSLRIELVPTFIFYSHNAEVGRIIETPKESLEKDLLQILLAMKKE